MTKSGFCQHPSAGSHEWCRAHKLRCDCVCHTDPSATAEEEARLVEERDGLAAGYLSGQEA